MPSKESTNDPKDDNAFSAQKAPQHGSKQPRVVGIGASAGGIQALRTFFSAFPAESDLAFVVVLHLAPDHESSLAEVLQTTSALPVQEVTGRTRVEPGHVYVIPPGKHIEVTDGHLDLSAFEEPRYKRAPIDHFFRTLAYAHPDGVGILLSGGGADGTVGMKAIKEQGGLLMAQEPEEAEHSDMPRSAISTGLVDFVLPAEELAKKLLELSEHADRYRLPEKPETLPETEASVLEKILEQLHARVGHDFSGYKRSTVLRRLQRRLQINQIGDLRAYLGFLRGNAHEAEALFRELLISVTNFFRDAEAWEALGREIIPKLFEGKADNEDVRVWVPGCATGEEAYTMAMLLREHAATLDRPPHLQVFACDLDEDALAIAREGVYPEAIAADVSDERLKRFFTRTGEYFQVKKELREMVLFAPHNLLRDPPFSELDLIACRNLLIYLQRDLQEKVFELLHYGLRPGGYLFLGSSESAEGTSNLFRPVDKKHRIYQRGRSSEEKKRLPDLPLIMRRQGHARMPRFQAQSSREPLPNAELHRRSLEAHAPPSVLVDENHDILHLSQTAGRYLRYPGGSPTHNILKAIRKELRLKLGTMLRQAFGEDKAVASGPLEVQIEGERRWVHLIVRPTGEDTGGRLALVVFAEAESFQHGNGQGARTDSDPRVQQLEEELEHTREQLQATIEEHETSEEELKASNEELQSMNEEYKSTLEELETSREELQSVNEELHTVNEELNNKVDELSRANNDLRNLMASTDVATIFLDRQLRIQRFTPQVERLFNVIERDRGRPLAHVTHKLVGCDDMAAEAQEVLETLAPTEHEVQDEEGRWYLVRMRPYRTVEDRIKGVVITFVDITRQKQAQEQVRRTEERHRLLLDQVKEYAIFTMDEEGCISSWNPGAERLFGYEEEEALGQPSALIFTSEDQAEDAAEKELETAAQEGQASDERWHVRKDGSRFWASGVLTALYDEDGGTLRGYAKVLRDNTHRRETMEALQQSREQLKALNETLEERVAERTAELEEKSEQVRRLASELVIAEQRERHRIAQVLHDDLQQQLYSVQMRLAILRRKLESEEPAALKQKLKEADEHLDRAISRARNLSVDLSPPVLQGEGLTDALAWLASQMEELHGLHVEVEADEAFRPKNQEMRVLLFQIVRELLFNVVKHADTDRASVELRKADDHLLFMRVTDEGKGFDPETAFERHKDGGGFGLWNLRERLSLFEGEIDIDSAPDEGTEVTVTVPVEWAETTDE